MKLIASVLGGLAAALVASSAQAGKLEIVYWGPGTLLWAKIGGSYAIMRREDTIEVDNLAAGTYLMEFLVDGATRRKLTLQLDSSTYAKSGEWCVELLLDSFSFLDEEDCVGMWDEYYDGW